jgi:hypothetical protein
VTAPYQGGLSGSLPQFERYSSAFPDLDDDNDVGDDQVQDGHYP